MALGVVKAPVRLLQRGTFRDMQAGGRGRGDGVLGRTCAGRRFIRRRERRGGWQITNAFIPDEEPSDCAKIVRIRAWFGNARLSRSYFSGNMVFGVLVVLQAHQY